MLYDIIFQHLSSVSSPEPLVVQWSIRRKPVDQQILQEGSTWILVNSTPFKLELMGSPTKFMVLHYRTGKPGILVWIYDLAEPGSLDKLTDNITSCLQHDLPN